VPKNLCQSAEVFVPKNLCRSFSIEELVPIQNENAYFDSDEYRNYEESQKKIKEEAEKKRQEKNAKARARRAEKKKNKVFFIEPVLLRK
jgi:molybdenum cofactor biosynthesis enzyme MoaA